MWPRKPPDNDGLTIYGDGSYGRVVKDPFPEGVLAILGSNEYADPERLQRARALFPEAKLSDFDVWETAPGKPMFRDKATGVQYRRDHSDPLLHPDPRASDIVCFLVDHGSRMHFLRPNAPRVPSETRLLVTSVVGRQPAQSEYAPPRPPAAPATSPTPAYSLFPEPRPAREPRDTDPDAALFAAVGIKPRQ